MIRVTRRWWLLATAGAPVLLGVTAQALSVRVDNDYLRITAPNLQFLTGKPLERLMDGRTASFLGQLTVATGNERIIQGRSAARFVFSYDIWTQRFKVTLIGPNQSTSPSKGNLTKEAAQTWCLDQLKIDLNHVPNDRPIFVRLEMRSEDFKATEGIVGEPGISLNNIIALFSRPVRSQQVRFVEEVGPLKVADLRRAHS